MAKKRVTLVMGAGVPLGFHLPSSLVVPSTANITEEVRKDYKSILLSSPVTIVEDMYQHLMETLPPPVDPLTPNPQPYVHFELLFHVMEMYLTYASVWNSSNRNSDRYPIFAPFISVTKKYDANVLRSVMSDFVLRIMDVVNGYDSYFASSSASEQWYRDFFQNAPWKWDVYNFNYDTTVEQSLTIYEDGYDDITGLNYKQFLPQKLMTNPNDLSTVNHLHGCIHFYYDCATNHDIYNYSHGDLFRYPDYKTARSLFVGRLQSQSTNQTNEELYAGPIITGLRKTDKLICIPYDYYHAHLGNSLLSSNKLLIAGYSFGDLYMNQQLNRMGLVHGKDRRVILIDFWNPKDIDQFGIENYILYKTPKHMQEFLMMMCEVSHAGDLPKALGYNDPLKPMFSSNGCLMLLGCGMRYAAINYYGDIINFLK